MKCSKRMCPMQQNLSDDCDIKDCPYRTEDVSQEATRALCNYIADLVVQKLKESEDKE